MSLDEVAQMCGVSVSYLNRLERGFVSAIQSPEKQKAVQDAIKALKKRAEAYVKETNRSMEG